MSANPPPPGNGREGDWNSGNRQPDPGMNQQSSSGWDQQPNTGWNQQSDNGWGSPANTGWGAPRQTPVPGTAGPNGEAWNGDASNGQGPYQQAQYSQAHSAHGAYATAPPAQQRSRKGLIALLTVVIIVAALGIGWGAATLFGNKSSDDSVAAPAASEPTNSGDESAAGQSPSDGASPSESAESLPDDPGKALEQLAKTDGATVKSDLDGKWVPQLSSKKEGLKADGKTWKNKDILAEHQEMREEFPRVQLVWSGDFKSFKEDNFWVTIVGIGYDSPEQALSWCSAHGLGPDYCYAKQLNTSGGYEGTTKLQD